MSIQEADQLARIERKLDEVLAFRDQLLSLVAGFAGAKGYAKLAAVALRGVSKDGET